MGPGQMPPHGGSDEMPVLVVEAMHICVRERFAPGAKSQNGTLPDDRLSGREGLWSIWFRPLADCIFCV